MSEGLVRLTNDSPPNAKSTSRLLFGGLVLYFLAAGLFVPGSSLLYRVGSCGAILLIAVPLFLRRDVVSYAKLCLVVACTSSEQVGFFFVLLTLVLFREQLIVARAHGLKPIRLLVAVGLVSYLLNQFVEINVLSYPLFVLSFFLPILFYPLFYRAADSAIGGDVLTFFFKILSILTIVVLVQTAVYWGQSPDLRSGGTLQAHMVAILLASGFIIALSRYLLDPRSKVHRSAAERLVLFTGLPLVFVVDAKYVLVLVVAAVVTVGIVWLTLRPRRLLPLGLAVGGTVGAAVALHHRVMDVRIVLSATEFGEATTTLGSLVDGFWITSRGQVLSATIELPYREPLVFFGGSGPGTFLSRAANSRAYDVMQKSEFDPVGGEREVRSKLPAVIPPFTSWITKKYALDVIHWSTFEERIWQSGWVRWTSSLTSFMWEFGIIGFALFLAFYGVLIKDGLELRGVSGEKTWSGLALAGLALFLLGVSYFDLWLEVPQFGILHWGLLAFLARSVQESSARVFDASRMATNAVVPS
jgi:hypothetical protein